MYQIKIFIWNIYYLQLTGLIARLIEKYNYLFDFFKNLALPEKFKSRVVAQLNTKKLPLQVTKTKINGIDFLFDLNDDVQRGIYFGAFENSEINLINEILPEDAICLDVGANIGYYALNIVKSKKNAQVYCFEPDPTVFEKLNINLSLNEESKRIKCFDIALSDSETIKNFYQSDDQHSGCGSINVIPNQNSNVIEVKTLTLDSFLYRNNLNKVDFIKIDIEGHEFSLLQGAVLSLKVKAIKYILIEFNGEKLKTLGYTFNDFISFFEIYEYYPVSLNLPMIKKIQSGKIDESGVCANFLFTY